MLYLYTYLLNTTTGDINTLKAEVHGIKVEMGGMKTQLQEILEHMKSKEKESQQERGVDDELDSLLSSFSFDSAGDMDPLGKKFQPAELYTGGVIALHASPSFFRPRSLSVPPGIRLLNQPIRADMLQGSAQHFLSGGNMVCKVFHINYAAIVLSSHSS